MWDQDKFLKADEVMQENSTDNAFDCSTITQIVRDPAWWATAAMLLELHRIGNIASAWGSSCPCHEWLTQEPESRADPVCFAMTQALLRVREALPLDHATSSGDGFAFACPLKGKRAPELAAGMLKPVVEKHVQSSMSEVLVACSDVALAQREKIINDFTLGVDHVRMTLEIKTGHWATLPWMIAGFALPNTGDSHRDLAKKMVSEFQKLPEAPVHHHDLTWFIMRPGSNLRSQVDALAAGNGDVLSMPDLLAQVAQLAFVPVVERIVEGAHSLVHRHTGFRKVTGAYVSCAHRLPEIDGYLENQEWRGVFLECFEQVRKPRRLAKAFRFHLHPLWLQVTGRRQTKTGLGKTCNMVMYSTDAYSMYQTHPQERKRNELHMKQEMAAKASVSGTVRAKLSQQSVLQEALKLHVRDHFIPGEFFSLPDSLSDHQTWVQNLNQALAVPSGGPQPSLALPDRLNSQSGQRFFKVVSVTAPNLKTVRSSRKRLARGDVVVTFHSCEHTEGRPALVDSSPTCCSNAGDPIQVLSAVGLDAESLPKLQRWKRKGECCFTLPHFGSPRADVILERFFDRQAIEGKVSVLKEADEVERRILSDMMAEGWVCRVGDDGWRLSLSGVKQLRVSQLVDSPKSICDIPPELALEDMTSWQLLKKLQDLGWSWQKLHKHSEPYTLGGPLIWYTSGITVRREYLLCLMQAPDILQPPCPEAPAPLLHHGLTVPYYQKMLDKDFDGAAEIVATCHMRRGRQLPTAPDTLGDRPMLADDGMGWRDGPRITDQPPVQGPKPKRGKKRKKPSSQSSRDLLAIDYDPCGEWASHEPDTESDREDLESDSSLLADIRAAAREGEASPPIGVAAGVGEVASSSSRQPDGFSVPEPPPSVGPPDEPPPSSVSPPDEQPLAGQRDREIQPETLVAWGRGPQKFRITFRKPTRECRFGAWQGICPLHKKSATAKCTKALNIANDTHDAKVQCLRMVQHWLVAGKNFSRAYQHSAFNPRFEETPPYEALLVKSEEVQIPDSVQADDALPDPSPKPAARPQAAKAKGKASAKVRGKAKASSSHPARGEDVMGLSSASTSSSTSSSSDSSSSGSD